MSRLRHSTLPARSARHLRRLQPGFFPAFAHQRLQRRLALRHAAADQVVELAGVGGLGQRALRDPQVAGPAAAHRRHSRWHARPASACPRSAPRRAPSSPAARRRPGRTARRARRARRGSDPRWRSAAFSCASTASSAAGSACSATPASSTCSPSRPGAQRAAGGPAPPSPPRRPLTRKGTRAAASCATAARNAGQSLAGTRLKRPCARRRRATAPSGRPT